MFHDLIEENIKNEKNIRVRSLRRYITLLLG